MIVGDATDGKTGTEVTFLPSPADLHHDRVRLFDAGAPPARTRLPQFRRRIVLTDARHAEPKREELFYEGGMEAFVRYLDRSARPLIMTKPVFVQGRARRHPRRGALWWNDSLPRDRAAASPTTSRSATAAPIWRVSARADPADQRAMPNRSGIAKKEKVTLTGEDCREGLTCVMSVKVPDPKFSSQTKDKLVSSEVRPGRRERPQRGPVQLVRGASRPRPRRSSCMGKVILAALRARGGAQGARDRDPQGRTRHRLPARQARRLPGARPGEMRILLVEGDSAGGSAKQGRDRALPGRCCPCAARS